MSEIKTESFEAHYLDPQVMQFAYEGQNLTLQLGEDCFPRVSLRRSFPLSARNTYVVVRVPDPEHDDRFQELGVIADCRQLDEASYRAVSQELDLFYLVPMIRVIHSIREEFGFLYWDVETDRGPKDFTIRDSLIGHVRQVGPGRWLIIDINQTRYEIRDYEQLDERAASCWRTFCCCRAGGLKGGRLAEMMIDVLGGINPCLHTWKLCRAEERSPQDFHGLGCGFNLGSRCIRVSQYWISIITIVPGVNALA